MSEQLVHVLTKAQCDVLQEIVEMIHAETYVGARAAVLVAPDAAERYEARTGRAIDDATDVDDRMLFPPSLVLTLVWARDIKFAKDAAGDAAPLAVDAILEAQGLSGDGRTPRVAAED